MLRILYLLLSISLAYSQCDANNDGDLSVIDVVIQVDCILNQCWEIDVEEDVISYDDYVYQTVVINGVHWMAENLRTNKFNNGDIIPNIEWDDGWTYNYEPACADYDESEANTAIYGKLYNQFAVNDDRGICPIGWHVASSNEYQELADYLGGIEIAGYMMKNSDTWDGSNQSNFNGLAGGCRASGPANGDCCMGQLGHFWTSSSSIYTELERGKDQLMFKSKDQRAGKSVRCIED